MYIIKFEHEWRAGEEGEGIGVEGEGGEVGEDDGRLDRTSRSQNNPQVRQFTTAHTRRAF